MSKTNITTNSPKVTLCNFNAWGAVFVTPFEHNAQDTTSLPPEYDIVEQSLILSNGHELLVL